MDKRYIYYCLLLAILVTGLFNIFMPRSAYLTDQHLKVGQIADKDIIAPFDFPLLKSEAQIKSEQDAAIAAVKPVYILSDEVQFNTIKTVNELFIGLIDSKAKADTSAVNSSFKAKGITISKSLAFYLSSPTISKQIYHILLNSLSNAYQIGIYDVAKTDTLTLSTDGELENIQLSALISKGELIVDIVTKVQNPILKSIFNELLPQIIKPNLIKEQQISDYLEKKAIASVSKATGIVSKNEILVRSNSRITEEDINKIQSLLDATRQHEFRINTWQSVSVNISLFLYFFILGLMLFAYSKLFYKDMLYQKFHFIPLIAGLALNAMLAIVNNQILGLQTLLIPYSLTIITAAILINVPFAMFYNFLSFAGIYPFVNWETFSPLVLVLATSGVLLLLSRLKDKHQYLSIWLYLVGATAGLTLVFALYKTDSIPTIIESLGYAFISSTLSVILMLFIVPFVEKKWNLATKQVLLELLDFNHPLLKKLATEAVGTYYHSLIVGNLAERAAEVIGANSLLARVGSYYHDIGKIVSPEFFTENNPGSQSIHDKLSPSESAEGIKNHVKEGIQLAQRYKIPSSVLDIILQHHGTSYIRYFLDKAEKSRIPFDLDQYRYEGPKPKSKEAVLVMIADIVESVAKSWDDVTTEDIKKILHDTVNRLIKEGQFDESDITLNDLGKVKECMVPILESIYRKRQQYPEADEGNEN
jgi:putative nucleotidyltransferase with HDIG domain